MNARDAIDTELGTEIRAFASSLRSRGATINKRAGGPNPLGALANTFDRIADIERRISIVEQNDAAARRAMARNR